MAGFASTVTKSEVSRLKCFGIDLSGVSQPERLEMNTIKRMKKVWAGCSIVLGMALILTAWLPTDLSAGSKGHAFGKSATTEKSGVSQLPGEPIKVLTPGEPIKVLIPSDPIKIRNHPGDPSGSAGNDRGIIIVSGKGGKDASTTLDAKKIQQGIKINPGGPVELNPQPLPPR
jgi:hypothetical protein